MIALPEIAMSGTALPEIAMSHTALAEIDLPDSRAFVLVAESQLVAKIEGHDSHELSHLFDHFDSKVFVRCVHLYQGPHQATGN
jgi:hypothetical protein